ncbi:SH3 domain-containing protein [Algoriphagus ratkowskyi]|uniref:SH3 domain-containing protein n=1 Tax=Algoriphagus ratkowskyi TaxID=57028 RepID=A0A2W7T305_9BACT|nr:tellurite resistance TerB C-terminal domain-containing protein [Algoriphagus ratkowskyi]PZX57582.1 SH3 domain-containing protein [Algoriphagus ratkowskyi]TXD78862.1 SH3 domain-containing protein [Algoriphagus ratkowskyi]
MKVLFTSVIFLLLLFVNTRSFAAEIYEVTSDVFVRSGIGTSYEAIGIAKAGDQINVLDKSNPNWFRVEFEEKIGYVSSKFLKISVQPITDLIDESVVEEKKESYPGVGLLILFLALFLIFEISRRRRNKRISKSITDFQNSQLALEPKPKKVSRVNENLLNRVPISVRTDLRKKLIESSIKNDESIIDVASGFSKSDPIPKKEEVSLLVPTWNHRYVYSKSDLNYASGEQKEFYYHFKGKFLEGIVLNIMGNTNYAFVLLFDLLDDYKSHKDISLLESQINNLGNNFYKTRSYSIKFLNDIRRERGLIPGLDNKFGQRIEIKPEQESYYDSEPDYVYWKVGSKYKEKLDLNDLEVGLLNKLWESTTNFCGIEFCYFQVIRLYLDAIAVFADQCEKSGSNLEEEFLVASDLIARKIFRYRKGSANYKMSVKNTSDEFYTTIFKLCENALRQHYGHKRKLSTEIRYSDPSINEQFEAKILVPFSSVIGGLAGEIPDPDEATQKELNFLNTSRWKDEFQRICTDFSGDEKVFIDDIFKLGELNAKNPSIENIFYEASKFIASKHKESSLILYMHYLYHDLKSVKFDNKQLTKTIQRNLFKTQEQVEQFETIVSNLLKTQDLGKAVAAVSQLYAIKRKRIKLDRNSIEDVKQQHAGTVNLLNEYLQDEEEEAVVEFKEETSESEEIEIHIDSVLQTKTESKFLEEIEFKPIHYTALELFAKNNFTVPISKFELFAKLNGVFRNQLIESINDACYEVLDDILIEEDGDFYTIETSYFNIITTQEL